MEARALKRRLHAVIAVDAACVLVAAAAIVGYVAGHIAILGPVFVAAIAAGVAAQIWFIVGFAKADPAKNASVKA